METKTAISVKGLTKTYKTGTEALKGINIEIPEGDFFALLGPNGAGKTTLISIVSTLTNKSGGKVEIFGYDIDEYPEKAKSFIGVVPQEFNFEIFETVENIVLTQAGYYGIPRREAKKGAEKYLKALGLWEKRNAKSMTLSGGMKRRLMIARALIHEPKILILDEPTAGVDIELRRGMWEFLRDLVGERRTIILTTHYLEEAEQLARHIAIINKGEIAESGSLKELLSKLHEETLVFDLDKPISDEDIKKLESVGARRIDENSIEMKLSKGSDITALVAMLRDTGYNVQSMRNKANRLEEFFLSVTKK